MHDKSDLPHRAELARKAIHLAVAISIVPLILVVDRTPALILLSVGTGLAVATEWIRRGVPWLDAFIDQHFGFMMRSVERGATRTVRYTGATWVTLAALLLVFLFPAPVAAAALAVGLIGDAVAALVGRAWGRNRWPRSVKTVEGSAAFVAGAGLAVLFFPGLPLSIRFAAVAVAAVIELVPLPIDDNLSVPLAAALVLWLGTA